MSELFNYIQWETNFESTITQSIEHHHRLISLTNEMMQCHFDAFTQYRSQMYAEYREYKLSVSEKAARSRRPHALRLVLRQRPLTTIKKVLLYDPPQISSLNFARQVGKFTEHIHVSTDGDQYSAARLLRNSTLKIKPPHKPYLTKVIEKTNALNNQMRLLQKQYMYLVDRHYHVDDFVLFDPDIRWPSASVK